MKEKKCIRCNEVKPVDAFEENLFSPDGRYLICKECFAKRLEHPPHNTEPKVDNQKKTKSDIAAPAAGLEKKASKERSFDNVVWPVNKKKASQNNGNQAEKIKKDQQAVLSDVDDVSVQAHEVLPKLRKCNGCKKIEPVGKAPLVPPKPVQAWFCEECIKNKKHQYVGKDYIVCDYWGRVYKVTRVVNTELVRGVVKKGDGSWSARKFDIYGQWQTKKPL